jgi:hypothetical protein
VFLEFKLETLRLTFLKHSYQLSHVTHVSIQLMLFFNYTILNLIYIVYLTFQRISNEKVVNCEVVDLIEYYNFHVDFVSI